MRGFSLGMRQRLGLAAALLTKPRLLVLDEPSNGLDPAGKKHVHASSPGSRRTGTAVVLSSHRMDDLEALCSEVTILATGRVVFSGPLDKLADETGELDYRLLTSDTDRGPARGRRHGRHRVRSTTRWRAGPRRCSWCARGARPRRAGARGSCARTSRCASSRPSSRRWSPRSSPSPRQQAAEDR